MVKQTANEKMMFCELCGRSTLHKICKGDFDDDPLSKICTKCGLWEEYKAKPQVDGFDRFQDDF